MACKTRLILGPLLLGIAIASASYANAQSPHRAYSNAVAAAIEDPSDPEKAIALAEAAARAGRIRQAIATLERLLAGNPDLSNIRLELGLLYLQSGAPELARSFIEQALADPAMPPRVRARAEQALEQAATQQRGWTLQGEISLALRYETNATAAPDDARVQFVAGGQELPATLRSEDTEQADVSFVSNASARAGVDLATQAGDVLWAGVSYYATRHIDQKQLDLDVFQGDIGPEIALKPRLGIDLTVRPYAAGALVRKDGRMFQGEYGGGLFLDAGLGSRTRATVRGDVRVSDFRKTAVDPMNNDRDAVLLERFHLFMRHIQRL